MSEPLFDSNSILSSFVYNVRRAHERTFFSILLYPPGLESRILLLTEVVIYFMLSLLPQNTFLIFFLFFRDTLTHRCILPYITTITFSKRVNTFA